MSRITRGTQVKLGTLQLGKQLGEGGFGVVHEASLAGIDHQFAIKFLDPSPFNTDKESARKRFLQEAELLLKLRHPNIIAIYGVGEHEGRPYILMERFQGVNLNTARKKAVPAPDSVLPFIEFVGGALAFAHGRGVVHRDIKPSNLMTVRGDARVLDFGIAAVLDPEGARLTRTGGTCVGDSFSAPELIENPRMIDPRCDVYSLGASWFWLLTGKAPKGLNWQAALRGSVDISPDYERVLLRCMDQPDARYENMQELVEEVRALRAGSKPKASQNDLSSDDILILGIIASACATPRDTTTFYRVEQEIGGAIPRFVLSVSNRRLLREGYIEAAVDTDWNGNESDVLRLSPKGELWVETHQARVAKELKRLPVKGAPSQGGYDYGGGGDEDIPF